MQSANISLQYFFFLLLLCLCSKLTQKQKSQLTYSLQVAAVLIENGASLEASTKKGFQPLHLAAKYGHMKVAELLLQKGAPVDAQGKNGVSRSIKKKKTFDFIQSSIRIKLKL